MLTLPLNASDNAILSAIHAWLGHLVRNEYDAAFELTCNTGHIWTPRTLQAQIAFYSDQFSAPLQLPPPDKAGQPEHHVVRPNPAAPVPKRLSPSGRVGSYEDLIATMHKENPAFLGEAVLQLPFGGRWSDVFATFELLNHKGNLVFALKSIYVH